jgi:hypothetical protein
VKLFSSPFEKLSQGSLQNIENSTMVTAAAVSPGGALLGKIDEMLKHLKKIEANTAAAAASKVAPIGQLDKATLKLIGPAAQGIAQAFKIIIDAIMGAPAAKEMDAKINSVIKGMAAVVGLGKAIFKFAAFLALSLPLLLIGMIALPLAVFMIAVLAGLFFLIDKMNIERSINKVSTGLALAGLAIVALAASLVLTEMLMSAVSDPWTTAGIAALLVVGTALIFWIAGKLAVDIVKGSLAMIVAGLSLIILSLGVYVMSQAVPDFMTGLGMIALIGGLGLVFGLIGMWETGMMTGIPLTITAGSLAMMVAGVSLLIIAAGVAIMAKATNGITLENAGLMGLIIGGLALAMAGAGLASPMIILGAAAMGLAGLALIPIAKGIKILAGVDFNKLFSAKGPFGDSGQMTEPVKLFGVTIISSRPMTKMEVMFEAIANSFKLGPLQLMALYATAPAMIMAGKALQHIAKGIEKFQALKINYDTFPDQMRKLVNTLADVFAEIGIKYPGGGGGFISALFGSGSGTSVVAQGISAVSGMGTALKSIAFGVQEMANLRFPTKWDKEGNAIEFRNLTNEDFVNLGINTNLIVTALSDTFAQVGLKYPGGKKSIMSWLTGSDEGDSPVSKGISAVGGMGSAISNIAEGVQAMANLRFPYEWDADGKPIKFRTVTTEDFDNVSRNTRRIVLALSDTFADVGSSDAAQGSTWFTSSDYEKGIKVVAAMGTPIADLATGIQGVADFKLPIFGEDGKITGYKTFDSAGGFLAKAGRNIRRIITTLADAFTEVGKGDDSGWFSTADIYLGIKAIQKLSSDGIPAVTKLADQIVGIKNLDIVDKIQDIHKALLGDGWWVPPSQRKKGIVDVFMDIGGKPGAKTDDSFFGIPLGDSDVDRAVDVINSINRGLPPLRFLFMAIQAMDTANAKQNADNLFGAMAKTLGIYRSANNFGWNPNNLSSAATSFERIAKAMFRMNTAQEKLAESMEDFKDSVNDLDLRKVREVRKLYEGLTYLYKNDGNQQFEQMNQSLVDALTKLAELLEKAGGGGEGGGEGGESGGGLGKIIEKGKEMMGGGKKPATQGKPGAPGQSPAPQGKDEISKLIRIIQSGIDVRVTNGSF